MSPLCHGFTRKARTPRRHGEWPPARQRQILVFEWGDRSTLTFACVTPLGGGVDRWFDGELRAFWNWRFGPQDRLTRVQF